MGDVKFLIYFITSNWKWSEFVRLKGIMCYIFYFLRCMESKLRNLFESGKYNSI